MQGELLEMVYPAWSAAQTGRQLLDQALGVGSLALTERGGRRQGCIDKGMKYEGWSLQKVDKEEGRENHWFEGRAKNDHVSSA